MRAACRSHGLPGTVLGIADDLSHGPLADGRARIDYMRSRFRGYDDWTFEATDVFAPWRKVIERLGRRNREAVVIWGGDNVSETTFLAMACWWLGRRPKPIRRVEIPRRDAPPYVALHTPAELAEMYSTRRALTESERVLLTADFECIRSQTGLLRPAAVGEVYARLEGSTWTITRDNGEVYEAPLAAIEGGEGLAGLRRAPRHPEAGIDSPPDGAEAFGCVSGDGFSGPAAGGERMLRRDRCGSLRPPHSTSGLVGRPFGLR